MVSTCTDGAVRRVSEALINGNGIMSIDGVARMSAAQKEWWEH